MKWDTYSKQGKKMPIDIEKDSLQLALKKLKARESVMHQLEAIASLGSWEVDLKTMTSTWSDESYKIYGIKKGTPVGLNTFYSLLLPQYLEDAQKLLTKAIKGKELSRFNCQIKRPDGAIRDLLINGRVIEDAISLKLIGTTQDVTELSTIKKEAQELSELLEHSSNEIYIINSQTLEYLYVNKGACKALGYSKNELMKKTIKNINPYMTKYQINIIKKKLIHDNTVLNRTIHQRKDGTQYHVQSYIYKLSFQGKDAVVVFDTDISEIIALEDEHRKQRKLIEYQAYHDPLTNLPNRVLFQDRLQQAIAHSKRNDEKFALLFIDLDQFKKINDSLGHPIGDKVLIETANRFQQLVREEDTLSRLGGDEFTIILKNIKDEKNTATAAQKLINSMKKSIEIAHHQLHISASIGISIYPDDTDSQEDLIKFADTAMYKAKDEGRNNFQFYSIEMTKNAVKKVIMENNLRIAIEEQQFQVYYQPQYDAKKEKMVGMEALVRWNHPHVGMISPMEFIPIAEENGLIIAIDEIVMQEAMKQFSKWYKAGLYPGKLALNLSMKQLAHNHFMTYLKKTMKACNFDPLWLELEITEGQMMQNPEQSIKKLQKLSKLGIEIAIDDFGTGYSSLSYLKKLPLHKLKIDQSFIRDIPKDSDDVAITKAIIAIAKSLNLKLLAEGVETQEQKEFIVEHECNFIQGYFYSRPINSDDMEALLKKQNQ